jgi:PIN domain nuclease of toxin-antitoxin system
MGTGAAWPWTWMITGGWARGQQRASTLAPGNDERSALSTACIWRVACAAANGRQHKLTQQSSQLPQLSQQHGAM